MNQGELINHVFSNQQIRENRIKLIARHFSSNLISRICYKRQELEVKIECSRIKGLVQEVLELTKKSMMSNHSFLQSLGGVKTIFDSVRSNYYDYYGYDFLDKSKEQIEAISVLFDNYWSLVEKAIPYINRREQIKIDTIKDNEDSWLNVFKTAHKKPYSDYACEIFLQLAQTNQFGEPELDDIGYEKSIGDPWYAAAVVGSLFFKGPYHFDKIYTHIIEIKHQQCVSYDMEKSDHNEIALLKQQLWNLAETFPWIQQLIPEEDNENTKKFKLVNDDQHLVALVLDLIKDDDMSSWFKYLKAGENPYSDCEVIYNKDLSINLDYLFYSVIPKMELLKTRIDKIPFNENRDYELCDFLLEDATAESSYLVIFSECLKSIGIPHASPSNCWERFIRARQKSGEHIMIDKVIKVLYQGLFNIKSKFEFQHIFDEPIPFSTVDLMRTFEELFISIDEATTSYHVSPMEFCQDVSVFMETNCVQHLKVTKDIDGNDLCHFNVYNNYKDKQSLYSFTIIEGLCDQNITRSIKGGYPPRKSDLMINTIIDENENYTYILKHKDYNDSYEDSSNYYLFFDTETTGLPRDNKAPSSDINNWPRLVQLSWIITDEKGVRLKAANRIIKPSGFIIPESSEKLHGIGTEMAMKIGRDINGVLSEFADDLKRALFVVGHNVNFDKKVIGAELIRIGKMDEIYYKRDVDTMKISCQYCKIPNGKNHYKYPSLQELHKILFGVPFNDEHDASSDVAATEKCFWELIRLGVFNVDEYLNPSPF